MKKIIHFTILFFIFFAVSCTVNSTTGCITIQNSTDKDAKNVRAGDYYIGFVGKGKTLNYYFYFNEKSDAKISADGFQPDSSKNGTIDLKLNYLTIIQLIKSSDVYTISASAKMIGTDENGTISMK
jgi:hypothetical protein